MPFSNLASQHRRRSQVDPTYVPLSIRDRSQVVSWLWRRTGEKSWLNYNRARRLARWLP